MSQVKKSKTLNFASINSGEKHLGNILVLWTEKVLQTNNLIKKSKFFKIYTGRIYDNQSHYKTN